MGRMHTIFTVEIDELVVNDHTEYLLQVHQGIVDRSGKEWERDREGWWVHSLGELGETLREEVRKGIEIAFYDEYTTPGRTP